MTNTEKKLIAVDLDGTLTKIVMGNNKMGADIYVDDRAIRPEEL